MKSDVRDPLDLGSPLARLAAEEARRAVEYALNPPAHFRLAMEQARRAVDETIRRSVGPRTLNDDWQEFFRVVETAKDWERVRAITERKQPWRRPLMRPDPWKAARALARHRRFLSSGFKKPRVSRALGRLRRTKGKAEVERLLREEIFPQGIMLVADDHEQPRRMRLGRRWVRDSAGRVGAFSPMDLVFNAEFYDWFRQEVHQLAEGIVLEACGEPPEPAQSTRKPNLEEFLAAGDPAARRWLFLRLAQTGSRYPERDQRVLLLYAARRTSAEIGQLLGLTGGAVRRIKNRLARRLA